MCRRSASWMRRCVLKAPALIKYGNKGNMTKKEIDFTCDKLIELKKAGQFRATWTTFDQSVQLMAAGEVVIQSMWSPAVAAVRVKQIPCVYAPVNIKDGKEGYRGWCNGMGLMKHLTGKKLDAAYEYMNWYMSGWQGAFVSRYGYYSPVPSTAKKFMTPAEYTFWYEGKPAPEPVTDPYGVPMEVAGTVRDGGSFVERVTNISCWNTLMDEVGLHEQALERLQGRLDPAVINNLPVDLAPTGGVLDVSQRVFMAVSRSMTSWLYISPLMLVLVPFFVLPILVVLVASVFETDGFGGLIPTFTLANYGTVLTSGLTYNLYFETVKFTILTWFFTLLLGFFVAYFLVFHVRNPLLAIGLFLICTVPFWTSNIIRMISWIPLLGKEGLINSALLHLGLIREPLEFLLYSGFAVVVAYVHQLTIFMIVPIFNSMARIDKRVVEAAIDAGASRFDIMRLIIVPLSKSGIALGSIFVASIVMGDFFVTKVMSGGGSASVVGAFYEDISVLQYPGAAASAIILTVILLVMVSLILRSVDIRKEITQ